MILSGEVIREKNIVSPFRERTRHNGVTYGMSYAGYDVRVDQDIDLGPGGFTLASTVEYFTMPNDIIGIVHDKSTWARLGLAVQNTVIEPGWEGYLTLELTNHNRRRPGWKFWEREKRIVIPRGTAICQILFHMVERPLAEGYCGKYQNQKRGAQPAILEKS